MCVAITSQSLYLIQAAARNARLEIFSTSVLGSASRNSICLGCSNASQVLLSTSADVVLLEHCESLAAKASAGLS
jgi:hypothetical protein